MDYYGSSYYWGGPYLWGTVSFPEDLAIPVETQPLIADRRSADSHLRSTAAVTGYHVEASDGEIGHVENFLTDQGTWKIRYLDVKTRNWLPGQKVLLSSAWVVGVSRAKSRVSVGAFARDHKEHTGIHRIAAHHYKIRKPASSAL